MAVKTTKNENLELAREHLDIAEDLINEESKKCDNESDSKKLSKAQFDLERAEADIEEIKGKE